MLVRHHHVGTTPADANPPAASQTSQSPERRRPVNLGSCCTSPKMLARSLPSDRPCGSVSVIVIQDDPRHPRIAGQMSANSRQQIMPIIAAPISDPRATA